jgi:hypothetical protein
VADAVLAGHEDHRGGRDARDKGRVVAGTHPKRHPLSVKVSL